MSQVKILIITEGATERRVGMALYEKGILSRDGEPTLPDWIIGPREGYAQVIQALKQKNPIVPRIRNGEMVRVLLMFDQEHSTTPTMRKDQIENDLRNGDPSNFWKDVSFQPISGFRNIFEHKDNNFHCVLHVSDAHLEGVPGCDFDGYILQILQGPSGRGIAARLVHTKNPDSLLRKAKDELTQLMRQNRFPWTHNKSWLYAYIMVFQYRNSHVSFAEDVVRYAPDDELRRVFASLIAAWDRLIAGGTL